MYNGSTNISPFLIIVAIIGIFFIFLALLLVFNAIKRVREHSSILTWTLVAFSLLWCVIFLCGTLRMLGVLPPVNDEITVLEQTRFLGINTIFLAAIGLCVCVIVVDLFIWILIYNINNHNMMWWICGSLFFFLAVVFVVACVAHFFLRGAYSLDQLFFGGCCASMALPGWALGLTYKEICVIVNIYLETGLCLFSALWLAKVIMQRMRSQATTGNYILTAVGVAYAIAYIIAFVAIVAYYVPPLDVAFDKCYHELINLAGEKSTTYNIVNYVIFISIPLVLVVFNCIAGYIIKSRTTIMVRENQQS